MITGNEKIAYEALQRKYADISQKYSQVSAELARIKNVDERVVDRVVPALPQDAIKQGYKLEHISTRYIPDLAFPNYYTKCYEVALATPYGSKDVLDLGSLEETFKTDLIIGGIMARFGVNGYLETYRDMLDYTAIKSGENIAFDLKMDYGLCDNWMVCFYTNKPVLMPKEFIASSAIEKWFPEPNPTSDYEYKEDTNSKEAEYQPTTITETS